MTVDGSMSLLGAEMPLAAAVKGVMADGEKLEMDMNMKMDMTNLASLVSAMGQTELSEEDLAMLAVMKEKRRPVHAGRSGPGRPLYECGQRAAGRRRHERRRLV
jgi:hypothetical protein